MSLFLALRNAARWAGFDLGRGDGAAAQAVVMIDPATGMPTSSSGVTASDGVVFNPDGLAQTLGYTDGNLTTITVSFGGNTYVQTMGYTAGVLTSVSSWVKQ